MTKLFRTITNHSFDARPAIEAVPTIRFSSTASRIFLRDLRVDMLLGIYDHEKSNSQPVVINVEADVDLPELGWQSDEHEHVVCYEKLSNMIKEIASSGHFNLVETLAERIAQDAMNNPMISAVKIRIEKVAVFKDAYSAGVEIIRMR
jgi:dihydroneopterin aldolase